jgi:SAM-dependent methyltransferase
VSDGPTFRSDLYRGTARYYDRFRLPYPDELLEDLCRRAGVNGRGRLLDLACGPGTVTFALNDRFAEVWAVDQEPESVAFAERRAGERGVDNIRWITGRAEDVDSYEDFDLVTVGTAFHRLDRPRVAEVAMRSLRPGGCLALLWSAIPADGSEEWQRRLAEIIVDWMERAGSADRVPADFERQLELFPHTKVLEDAGLVVEGRSEFAGTHDWSIAGLIGFLYSTSVLSKAVLGDRAPAFEADLEARMRAVEPSGVFRERTSFAYDLARRPASR